MATPTAVEADFKLTATMTDEEYRKMILVLLVRGLNGMWDGIQRYYQVFPASQTTKGVPEHVLIAGLGITVVHPHPDSDSTSHQLYEVGVIVPDGVDLPESGAWSFVGDELTRALLVLTEGRPSKFVALLNTLREVAAWCHRQADAKEAGATT